MAECGKQNIEIVSKSPHSMISILVSTKKDSVSLFVEDDYYLSGDDCFYVKTGFNLNSEQAKRLYGLLDDWLKNRND